MSEFSKKIEQIKTSPEQVREIESVSNAQIKSVLITTGSGILATLLVLSSFFSEVSGWIVAIGLIVICGAVVWAVALLQSATVLAKQQDRKYFLECIRAAKNVDELHEAGLFGNLWGLTKEDLDEKYDEIQRHLADALDTKISKGS
jgi:hypothetical protein